MIGLALSGGGSRAAAFHLGCLRALNDLRILEKVGVLSTISGGSLIGAYYAYTPEKSFEEFEQSMRLILREGLQKRILKELLKPKNLLPAMGSFTKARVHDLALLRGKELHFRREHSRTDLFRLVLRDRLYADIRIDAPRRNNMDVVIGSCDIRTGSAFRFGSTSSGSYRHGSLVDPKVDLALAVAASAAYPIFLPALDRTWQFTKNGARREQRVLLTDGGVYDNLGLQVLEPGRDADYSLHTFPCENLIVCNAGFGQDDGSALSTGFFSRVPRAFNVVHRRVQDSAMHRLHLMKEAGVLKGFALPYLGQQDHKLQIRPSGFVAREEVMGYPTNFAAMPDVWIDRLSNRGEQLTRTIVSMHLPELLEW